MRLITSLFLLSLYLFIRAQDIPQPMQPPRMVNDFSGLLTSGEQNQLEQTLQSFY